MARARLPKAGSGFSFRTSASILSVCPGRAPAKRQVRLKSEFFSLHFVYELRGEFARESFFGRQRIFYPVMSRRRHLHRLVGQAILPSRLLEIQKRPTGMFGPYLPPITFGTRK